VKANASVPGLPDIRSGTVLLIDGVGERFSGRYFVTSTTHSIGDSGYTTQFECRREEI
jgi:phage protein D